MKRLIFLLLSIALMASTVEAKTAPKKTKKKEVKKVEKKVEPPITEFQVVEDQTKFQDIVDEGRHCNIARGIHMQYLVQGPHKTLFFVCGSLEPIKKTKNKYTPNIEDPYTIHWITNPRKRFHFSEMGGFGGEKSDIEVSPEKILIHVSIPWGKNLAPLYTREITCDDKNCNATKFICDIKPEPEDVKLLPEFSRFLDTIADPKNRKNEAWDDVWNIYIGKVLFQALSSRPEAIEFLAKYPQKDDYPADGTFAETLMVIRDDLELARKAGCIK